MTETKEIGVIPYFIKNDTFFFVIVTARNHPGRWIFPKGQPEETMTDREIAVNEAFEEAGIIGTIQGKGIKTTVKETDCTITYKLYPFKVSKICRKWPEKSLRKRKIVNAEKAAKQLKNLPYSEALNQFLKKYLR